MLDRDLTGLLWGISIGLGLAGVIFCNPLADYFSRKDSMPYSYLRNWYVLTGSTLALQGVAFYFEYKTVGFVVQLFIAGLIFHRSTRRA